MNIVRALGLTPLDQGSLLAAQEIENYPLRLFPMWKFPILLSFGLAAFFFFYCLIRNVIYPYVYENEDFSFFIAISIPNRICPILALILLALVYLPGVLAAIIQLYRGTKYHRFPDWLDKWMLCRKQLGLVALAFASLHVLYTLVIPIRYFVRWRMSGRIISQVRFVPTPMSSFFSSPVANTIYLSIYLEHQKFMWTIQCSLQQACFPSFCVPFNHWYIQCLLILCRAEGISGLSLPPKYSTYE